MNYSVAQAKNDLSKLIARAEAGEEVMITRRGVVVAKLTPPRPSDQSAEPFDIEGFRKHRIHPKTGPVNIVETLEAMRREEEEKFL